VSDTVDVAARVEPAPAGRPSRGLPRRIGEAFLRRREASVLVVAVGLGIYFASASPAFLTKPNMVNIASTTAPAAIIAVIADSRCSARSPMRPRSCVRKTSTTFTWRCRSTST